MSYSNASYAFVSRTASDTMDYRPENCLQSTSYSCYRMPRLFLPGAEALQWTRPSRNGCVEKDEKSYWMCWLTVMHSASKRLTPLPCHDLLFTLFSSSGLPLGTVVTHLITPDDEMSTLTTLKYSITSKCSTMDITASNSQIPSSQ
ncbi:hypothetical protein GLAREA_07736 [Glarea lozoyensis ATCC 20868]|uniref:Uncharacterized protein n=1 Tax=Glarea lozoyensis (strain ATCC 20868 / MF5171) TaxID=1116229 RepID=S3D230_GLAL2|nr:uncharacterized protein GLAREA_07736 [Glarea lozoyensis ATCC 20868]EPE32602.1 hypothetical protein GLAREA_07736 [Glarea lozoyensis ATCC 20868]